MTEQDAIAGLCASLLSNATLNVVNASPFPETTGLVTGACERVIASGIEFAANGQIYVPTLVIGSLGNGNTSIVGWVNVSSTITAGGVLTANAGLVVNGTPAFNNTVSANGGIGTINQVLLSGGAGANAYWGGVSAGALSNTTISGFANLSSTLQVANTTLLNGLLTANAGAVVNGTVAAGNTTVTGFVNISSTLQVTGAGIVNGLLTANGLVVGPGPGGPGGTTLNGTLAAGNTTVTGFVNISSTLQVTGLTTLTGNTTVAGFANVALSVNVGTTLHVVGAVTHDGVLTQTGNASFAGYVNVAQTLQVTGNVIIGAVTNDGVLNAGAAGGNVYTTVTTAGTGYSRTWWKRNGVYTGSIGSDANGVFGVAAGSGVGNQLSLDTSGNMTAAANATFGGFVNVGTILQVAGLTTLTGNTTVTGFINTASTLQVAGQITAGAGLLLTGTLEWNTTGFTGGNTVSLGTNSPVSTPSAPFTWIQVRAVSGQLCYFPVWK
jgi:fibronectin-binding autotransporter adhesin